MEYLYFTKWLITKYPIPFVILAGFGIIGGCVWQYGNEALGIIAIIGAVITVCLLLWWILKQIIIDPIKSAYKEYQLEKRKTFEMLKR